MSDKKLDEMKEEYKDMRIPVELRKKVVDSIEKAKKENQESEDIETHNIRTKKGSTMKKTHFGKEQNVIGFYLKRAVQIAAGFLVAITIAANANAGIANAMEKIPVIGAITRVVTFRNYEVIDENMQAEIKIPKVEDVTENQARSEAAQQINKSVEEYTNQIIAEFESDIAEFGDYEGEDGGPHEAVYTDYEVIMDTDTIFSLRINTTISKGGSANMAMIYHIDKRTDSVLSLKDIFVEGIDYITILSDNVKEQMRQKVASDDSVSYFIDSEVGLEEYDFKSISEKQNFYFNENGTLVLVFDEYEVAPGYMGMVEFEIPTTLLQGIVKEGYVK